MHPNKVYKLSPLTAGLQVSPGPCPPQPPPRSSMRPKGQQRPSFIHLKRDGESAGWRDRTPYSPSTALRGDDLCS